MKIKYAHTHDERYTIIFGLIAGLAVVLFVIAIYLLCTSRLSSSLSTFNIFNIFSTNKIVSSSSQSYSYEYKGKTKGIDKISFTDKSTGLPAVSIGTKDASIVMRYIPKSNSINKAFDISTQGNKITYNNIEPNTNLIYTVQGQDTVKEDIELVKSPKLNPNETLSYTFDIELSNLTYDTNSDGSIIPIFKDKMGRQYSIPPLIMTDAKGNTSTDLNMYITLKDNPQLGTRNLELRTSLIAVLTPSTDWLTAKARVYPVLIDPTLTWSQTNWFDDRWGYRQTLSVSNSSGSTQSNIQIKVLSNYDMSSLVTASKLQSNLNDLRFTDMNGLVLKYWIEDATNSSVDVWVMIPSIQTVGTSIFMYYGNSSASAGKSTIGNQDFPGLSCKAIYISGVTTDDVYYISPNGLSASAYRVYCDMTYSGGGWTMMLKTTLSTTFQYDANYWTTNNTLNPTDATRNDADAKYQAFNELLVTDLMARWPDAGDIRWLKTSAWTARTPLTGFNEYRSWGVPQEQSDWNATYFSGQVKQCDSGPGVYGTKLADLGGIAGGSRWGYRFNENGCGEWNSDDVGGGFGVKVGLPTWRASVHTPDFSAGDWYECCGTTGMNRTARGEIYGRETNIASITTTVASATPTNEEKSPAPIAYWKFDEGVNTSTYDSVNTNHGSFGIGSSAPTWQSEDMCVSGKCLKFDGSNDYVSFGYNSKFDFERTDKFSVSVWVKTSDTSNNRNIIGNGIYSQSGWAVTNIDTNQIKFSLTNSASNRIFTDITPSKYYSGEWTYITFTYDGSSSASGVKAYINGVLVSQEVGSDTLTGSIKTANEFAIGKPYHTSQYFNGFIDEPKIYNYVRSADQIKTDYLSKGSVSGVSTQFAYPVNKSGLNLAQGLVGYWKMDEGASPSIDSSGNGSSGAWQNSPSAVAGKYDKAISLNAYTNTYIDVGNISNLNFGTGDFTISSWINPADMGAWEVIAAKGTTATGYSIRVNTWNTSDKTIVFKCGSGTGDVTTSTDSITFSVWQHITVTRKSGIVTIYLNGTNVKAQSCPDDLSTSSNFQIGRFTDSFGYYNGSIDEVRIYNRALSPQEVIKLYNWAPGPFAYYDFEEGSGTTFNNKSGNNLNGVLNGSPQWVAGRYGKGIRFTGTIGQNGVVSGFGNSAPTEEITVEFWVKNETDATNREALWIGNDSPDRINIHFGWPINQFWDFGTCCTHRISLDPRPTVDGWHHFAYVSSVQGNYMRIYKDGIQIGSNTAPGTFIPGNYPLYIGSMVDGINPMLGTMDEIKFYNYARTQKQIVEDMNAGHPAPGSPVGSAIAHYKFDEGFFTIANNSGSAGTTLNGTLTNMSSPATATSGWTNSGKFNKALVFDGGNDYVNISNNISSLDSASAFTFSLWFNRTGSVSPNGTAFFGKLTSGGYTNDILLAMDNSGTLFFQVNNGADGSGSVNVSSKYTFGTWAHLVAVFDGTQSGNSNRMKLFLDGDPLPLDFGSYSVPATSANMSGYPQNIGQYPNAGWSFTGNIDDFKIYNFALTEDQVKADFNQGKSQVMGAISTASDGKTADYSNARAYCPPGDTTSCASPVAEWKFEEGSGTTVYDTGTAKNIGAWTGTVANQWGIGKIGNAGNFTSSPVDYIQYPFTYYATPTVEAWVKLNTDSSIFSASGNNNWMWLRTNLNNFDCFVTPAAHFAWDAVSSSGINFTNTWRHIACSFDNEGILRAYVDGVNVGTLDTGHHGGLNVPSGSYYHIGYMSTYAWGTGGLIDNVLVYDYIRTPAQIAWDYNRGAPVAWYKFDECQGTTIYNSTKNGNGEAAGNNGTLTIGASQTNSTVGTCATSGAWYDGSTGKINSSIDLDGSDDYVSVPDSPALNVPTDNFSLSVWLNLTSKPANNPNIVGKLEDFKGYGIYVEGTSQGNTGVRGIFGTSGTWGFTMTNSWPTLGVWNHYVLTYDKSYLNMYVNGVLTSHDAYTNSASSTANPLIIGRHYSQTGVGWWLDGKIDDVRIFNYALTPSQVRDVYNNGAVSFK